MGPAIAIVASLLGIDRRLAGAIVIVAAIVAAGGAIWGGYALIRKSGADAVRTEIERQNNEAGIKGATTRDNLRRCTVAGGVWDFRAGKCRGAAGSDRP